MGEGQIFGGKGEENAVQKGEWGDGARVLWEYRGVLVMIDCHRWISLSIYLSRHPPSLLGIEQGKIEGGG